MLFTPGPTNIPQSVLAAMSVRSVHHRTPEFRELFCECRKRFAEFFQTPTLPIFLTCSGTGGLEAVLRSVASAGDTIAYVNGGKFGERWGHIAAALGIHAIEIVCEWGSSVTEEQIREAFSKHPEIKAFGIQHSETSTGVLHPIKKHRELIKSIAPDCLYLVDAISSLATADIDFSLYDAVVGGSQKALMLPPGLATVNLSERAWKIAEKTPKSSLYFDLEIERRTQENGDGAWTPAISLLFGMKEVLNILEDEGLATVIKRHASCSKTAREGLQKIGFTTLSDAFPAPAVTPAKTPEGNHAGDIISQLVIKTGKRIAGCQNEWKGKAIRIGHMGQTTPEDIQSLLADLEALLP